MHPACPHDAAYKWPGCYFMPRTAKSCVQGENKPGVKDAVRSGADRVYDYDVYNNLGRGTPLLPFRAGDFMLLAAQDTARIGLLL